MQTTVSEIEAASSNTNDALWKAEAGQPPKSFSLLRVLDVQKEREEFGVLHNSAGRVGASVRQVDVSGVDERWAGVETQVSQAEQQQLTAAGPEFCSR